jgi:hypothetical protein
MCVCDVTTDNDTMGIQRFVRIFSLARNMLFTRIEEDSSRCFAKSYDVSFCGSEFGFWCGPIIITSSGISPYANDSNLSFIPGSILAHIFCDGRSGLGGNGLPGP